MPEVHIPRKTSPPCLSLTHAVTITTYMSPRKQLCLGVHHLHEEKKVLHRDIKPNNVFLMDSKKLVQLGDFGLARVIKDGDKQVKTEVSHTHVRSNVLQTAMYTLSLSGRTMAAASTVQSPRERESTSAVTILTRNTIENLQPTDREQQYQLQTRPASETFACVAALKLRVNIFKIHKRVRG